MASQWLFAGFWVLCLLLLLPLQTQRLRGLFSYVVHCMAVLLFVHSCFHLNHMVDEPLRSSSVGIEEGHIKLDLNKDINFC